MVSKSCRYVTKIKVLSDIFCMIDKNTYSAPSVGFVEAIVLGFQDAFNWNRPASKSEFWWWQLFSFIVVTLSTVVAFFTGVVKDFTDSDSAPTVLVFVALALGLVLTIPTVTVMGRRLLDAGLHPAFSLVFYFVLGQIGIVVAGLLPSKGGADLFSSSSYSSAPNGSPSYGQSLGLNVPL
jgi:uncharacterized membrane protein YhaH (DUF805 family)